MVPSYLYLPRISKLLRDYITIGYIEAKQRNFPDIFSTTSYSYYFRNLVNVQMLPFLFAVFIFGLGIWLFNKRDLKIKLFLISSIVSTYAVFTLIGFKVPNSTVSFLIFFALISAGGLLSIRAKWLRRSAVYFVVIVSLGLVKK